MTSASAWGPKFVGLLKKRGQHHVEVDRMYIYVVMTTQHAVYVYAKHIWTWTLQEKKDGSISVGAHDVWKYKVIPK